MRPDQLLLHHDTGALWDAGCGLDVAAAYARAAQVRQLRIARGEQPRGYKVGFTNRTIWARYGVHAPIWGTVWDGTLAFCEGEGEVSLQRTCQPRIEPECVFGLQAAPPASADLQALRDCIAWIAPGFEVVQSHLADWKFSAGDTIADGGLHARLLVGARIDAATLPREAGAFDALLAGARVVLRRDGTQVDAGVGANVLDGPLHALLHFVTALQRQDSAAPLQPGDVVTTGTWTDAWPIAPGERWRADFQSPLAPLAVRFT